MLTSLTAWSVHPDHQAAHILNKLGFIGIPDIIDDYKFACTGDFTGSEIIQNVLFCPVYPYIRAILPPCFSTKYLQEPSSFLILLAVPFEFFLCDFLDRRGKTKFPYSYEISRSRSEEHTSELQSLRHLVCRLLLE